MRRREKGDRRNHANPIDKGDLSPQDIERLLQKNKAEIESRNVEQVAAETVANIDEAVDDFSNIPTGLEKEVSPEDTKILGSLNESAETAGQTAKEAIEVVTSATTKEEWGRHSKKATSPATHFEPAVGKIIHSGAPRRETPINNKFTTSAKKLDVAGDTPPSEEITEPGLDRTIIETPATPVDKPDLDPTKKSVDQIATEAKELTEEEKTRTLINSARSLDSLKSIIQDNNIVLTGADNTPHDTKFIIDSIDGFMVGSVPPRACGLRQKVCELVLAEDPTHGHALDLLAELNRETEGQINSGEKVLPTEKAPESNTPDFENPNHWREVGPDEVFEPGRNFSLPLDGSPKKVLMNTEELTNRVETGKTTTEDELKTKELIEAPEFKDFFANLTFDDLKDTKQLKEKFSQMMSDEMLDKLGLNKSYFNADRYFENFCQQSEAILKEHIAHASPAESGMKREGKKFLKGVVGGGTYAAANRAVMFGLRTLTSSGLAIKLAAGGVTGAAVSGINYMVGHGYEKLSAKSMTKLAKQAEKLQTKGVDQKVIFEQLQGDLSALMQFDRQQAETLGQQREAASKMDVNVFSGESVGDKEAKLKDIQGLLSVTNTARNESGEFKNELIKDRQEMIKKLTENGALEEYITHQITEKLKEMSNGRDLSEDEVGNLTLQANLMVEREMNTIMGDIMAQEKFEEIDKRGKSSYEKSYVGKMFSKTPPESLMQALGKGFVSGSVAGVAYSDAIGGAIYMAMQRMQGSLRAELMKKSESEVKTTKDILNEFKNFEIKDNDYLDQAHNLIGEARARIKLPDIKEAERAKIELEIDSLQNKVLMHVETDRLAKTNNLEINKLAKTIVASRDTQISQAAEIAAKEKKRKGISGLWKTFKGLSGKEKLKVLGRTGLEGIKGGVSGAIGAELVTAGSAATSGEDYDISQGIDNVINRATFQTGIVAEKASEIGEDKEEPVVQPVAEIDTNGSITETTVDDTVNTVPIQPAEKIINEESTVTESTGELDPTMLAKENQIIEDTKQIGQALIEGNQEKVDTLIQDSALDSNTIDQLKNLATVEQKVGVNSFESGITVDDLDKIVCELDNDPTSKEAADSRQALEYLMKNGDVSLEQYQRVMANHIGEELHLGNENIVKNAIENSQIDVVTVVETQARVQAEKELGVNTYDGEVTDEELAKITEQAKGGNNEYATGILEELHEAGKISDQQLFSLEHASLEKAGFKEDGSSADQDKSPDKEAKHNLTLELGQDGAPKHLEQLFYRVGIDGMDFGKEGVTNVEAAQILNVGANLRVLSEGHDIAGLTAEDFQKYVTINEGGKVTINDYEGFQEHIVDPLIEHAGEIITADNVADTGAVAYIDNIQDATWGDMLSPEGVEEEAINLDQGEIDAAEGRLFQQSLEKSELGELATDIKFEDEDNGSFSVDGEEVEIHENQVVKISQTPLETPIQLGDKESGATLIDQVSEVKAKEFLSFVEGNKETMMARLNGQLDNQAIGKMEIIPPVLPTPEYDISVELKSTLDKLGFGKGQGSEEWEFLKEKSVDDLLNKKIEGHSGRADFLEGRHRAHMREFFQHAINEGELRPPKAGGPETINEAMKELMVKETREKLISDISLAEKKVAAVEKIEESTQSVRSETLGDQLKEKINSQTTEKISADNSESSESSKKTVDVPEWLTPEHKAELDKMMPDGWKEQDIPMYMRENKGHVNFDDKVEGVTDQEPTQEISDQIPEWLSPAQKAEMDQMMPDGWKEQDIPMYMRENKGHANFDDKVEGVTEQPVAPEQAPDVFKSVEIPAALDFSNKSPEVTIIGQADMQRLYTGNHMEINALIKNLDAMRVQHGDDKDFVTFEADVAQEIKDLEKQNQEMEDIASGKITKGTFKYNVSIDAIDPTNVNKYAEAKMSVISSTYNLSSDSSDKMEAAMAQLDDEVAEFEAQKAEQENVGVSATELYRGLFNDELKVEEMASLDATELQVIKMRLEAVNDTLKEGPPDDSSLDQKEIDKILKENNEIILKIEKQIAEKSGK